MLASAFLSYNAENHRNSLCGACNSLDAKLCISCLMRLTFAVKLTTRRAEVRSKYMILPRYEGSLTRNWEMDGVILVPVMVRTTSTSKMHDLADWLAASSAVLSGLLAAAASESWLAWFATSLLTAAASPATLDTGAAAAASCFSWMPA